MRMTSAAATASARPRWRLVYAALAVSAVLNLLFVAGAVWTAMRTAPAHGFPQRLERIGNELDLDRQQRAAFDEFIAAMRVRSDRVQQQVSGLYGAAWDEAGKPSAEPAQVLRLFDRAFDKRREINRETILQTLDFLATLSPEQRTRFVSLARDRRNWRN
jgi:uncharacterized membrane protein